MPAATKHPGSAPVRGALRLLAPALVAGVLAGAAPGGGARAQSFDDFEQSGVEAPQQQPAAAAPAVAASTGSPARRPAPVAPGQVFRDCAGCPEMVAIPAGSFLMGSPRSEPGRFMHEGPEHMVAVERFALGRTEVTYAEWDACVAAGACSHVPDFRLGDGTTPATHVSWHDAQQYVRWLSRRTGQAYRLPSEAEWEYAARAGSAAARPWGDEIGSGLANCDGCGSPWDNASTAPVGSFPANDFGLADMLGNVWEWTQDCWNDSYGGAPADGSAWLEGACYRRVVRGGSWEFRPAVIRSAVRLWAETKVRHGGIGFRVARSF